MLDGKRISDRCSLWITSRSIKDIARRNGLVEIIERAGGVVMTDTCSAMALAVPQGTKVAATDSAKQTHYLPSMLGVQAWFGTTAECIDGALTGKWQGVAP